MKLDQAIQINSVNSTQQVAVTSNTQQPCCGTFVFSRQYVRASSGDAQWANQSHSVNFVLLKGRMDQHNEEKPPGKTLCDQILQIATKILRVKQLGGDPIQPASSQQRNSCSSCSSQRPRVREGAGTSGHTTVRPGARWTPALEFRNDPSIEFQTLSSES